MASLRFDGICKLIKPSNNKFLSFFSCSKKICFLNMNTKSCILVRNPKISIHSIVLESIVQQKSSLSSSKIPSCLDLTWLVLYCIVFFFIFPWTCCEVSCDPECLRRSVLAYPIWNVPLSIAASRGEGGLSTCCKSTIWSGIWTLE